MSVQSLSSRRVFLSQVAVGGCAVIAFGAQAQTPAKVDEKDPQAVALGYMADTAKVDNAKYKAHTKEQKCGGCALYSGKAGEASGPCGLFPGKHVAAGGWCSAWAKKA
jgi:hypothetical protein